MHVNVHNNETLVLLLVLTTSIISCNDGHIRPLEVIRLTASLSDAPAHSCGHITNIGLGQV